MSPKGQNAYTAGAGSAFVFGKVDSAVSMAKDTLLAVVQIGVDAAKKASHNYTSAITIQARLT